MSLFFASLSFVASIADTPAPQTGDVFAQPRVLLARKVTAAAGQADVASNLVLTKDGAWIVGWTSKAGQPTDGLLLHVDSEGEVLARKQIGGAEGDLLWSIQGDGRGGWVCVGIRGVDGHRDGWMVGLDAQGEAAWDRTFGKRGDEWLVSLRATKDGWIAVGQTPSESAGEFDALVVRTDREGRELFVDVGHAGPRPSVRHPSARRRRLRDRRHER